MLKCLCILLLPFALQAQTASYTPPDSVAFFAKANSVQFADYTPKPGKAGKDVSLVIEIATLGALSKQGKNGNDGPAITVYVKVLNINDQQLLLVSIPNPVTGLTDSFFVDPRKGQLKIIADGANGGAGGTSEKGFKGETGKAGKGGSIEVLLDSNAIAFTRCKCLLFSNKDGTGRDQPKDTNEVLLASGELLRPYDKPVVWKLMK